MKKRFLVFLTVTIFVLPIVLFAAGAPTKDLKVTKIGNKKGPAIYSHVKHEKAGITEDHGKAAIACARRLGIDIS